MIGVLLLLGVLGAVGAVFAWRMAVREPESEPRIEVLAGIGGGLVTGIAIGVSALFLEQSFGESQEYAAWRANVEIAGSIPGFTPKHKNIDGINFSGKELPNADLSDAHLESFRFRETNLRGADLTGAHLQNAELIGTNLYQAGLSGAHLEGASLHSANLTHAVLGPAKSFAGAKVNLYTCWPKGVPQEVLNKVTVEKHNDEVTGKVLGASDDMRDGIKGGEEAPRCTLWKGAEEVR
ncbi:pentapeptide repeat-containing protein [Streptomyces sp. NPDC090445]|uniref:pentapeptide repeat-containing protein n=1 Tax=Streptomyces sp. NPDC090445 TaxID=3365963 RepID=UPI0037FF4C79